MGAKAGTATQMVWFYQEELRFAPWAQAWPLPRLSARSLEPLLPAPAVWARPASPGTAGSRWLTQDNFC